MCEIISYLDNCRYVYLLVKKVRCCYILLPCYDSLTTNNRHEIIAFSEGEIFFLSNEQRKRDNGIIQDQKYNHGWDNGNVLINIDLSSSEISYR